MKRWAQRTGVIMDATQKEIHCEVNFYEHNWRGCFITIRPLDSDEYLGFHGIRATYNELAKEYGFDEATVYSYDAKQQQWECRQIGGNDYTPLNHTSSHPLPTVPGFLMERQIHFGDFANSYEDFIEQTRAAQRHFAEEACNVVIAGKMRRAYSDESDALSAFENPAPHQKAIEAFNEELQQKRFTAVQPIKIVPAHLHISQQEIIADPEAEQHEAVQKTTQELNPRLTY